jgi:hypothetical protein
MLGTSELRGRGQLHGRIQGFYCLAAQPSQGHEVDEVLKRGISVDLPGQPSE